jgi:hypothetical protein
VNEYAYPTCMNCGKICKIAGWVETDYSKSDELWCYCKECNLSTFHPRGIKDNRELKIIDMKVYEDKLVPAHTIQTCVKRKCDLCGTESMDCDWKETKWNNSETEVAINARRDKYYGNDGDSETCEIDLCPKCFWDRLVPWLKSQGANVEEKSFSW